MKPDADIEQVKKDISQIEFGTGKISVENKITRHEVSEVRNKKITNMFWDICELLLNLLPINSCDLENTVLLFLVRCDASECCFSRIINKYI